MRVIGKYGERALMECGHLAQNLLLVGTALSLGRCLSGGFWTMSSTLICVSTAREAVFYVLFMG